VETTTHFLIVCKKIEETGTPILNKIIQEVSSIFAEQIVSCLSASFHSIDDFFALVMLPYSAIALICISASIGRVPARMKTAGLEIKTFRRSQII
jgi:hypothetical protein